MNTVLSDNALAVIARTRPLLERHRERLQRATGRYMARVSPHDRASGRAEASARAILAMLLEQSKALSSREAARAVTPSAHVHLFPGIEASDYARFGDGLAASLRDVLGREASPGLLWGWVDAYWSLARSAQGQALALAA